MDIPQIILALGWPHFSFALGVVFLLLFRAPLIGLLSRITSIDKSGIKTQPNPEIQREHQLRNEAAQELMLAVGNTIVLQELETRIRGDLVARHLDAESETTKVLVKYLAAARLSLEFEQIHNLIFGSQMLLLRRLNEVTGLGQSLDVLQSYFDEVRTRQGEVFTEWTLEQYLAFLCGRNLIVLQDGRYHISELGKEYLVWVARNGRGESNPL